MPNGRLRAHGLLAPAAHHAPLHAALLLRVSIKVRATLLQPRLVERIKVRLKSPLDLLEQTLVDKQVVPRDVLGVGVEHQVGRRLSEWALGYFVRWYFSG